MKKQTIWILLGLSTLMYSCKKETNTLPSLVLSEYTKSKFTYFDCDAGKFFQGFGAAYLENTSECTPEDVRKMEIWKDKVYILVKDKLVRYNVRHGEEELCYNNPQDYSVKSFDLDTLKQELYWIDGTNNELYKYEMQKDSVLQHFPLPNEAWDHCVCLSNDKILLTTRNYPNNIYYIFDSTNGATQKFQQNIVKKASNRTFPDTLGLSANMTGHDADGVLFKSLLNDTVYQWNGKRFIPKFFCDTDNEGLTYKKRKDNSVSFKDNDMMTLTSLNQVGNWYFLGYKKKIQNGKFYYSGMNLLNRNLSLANESDMAFYITGKTIQLWPKYPYFPNKERTSHFQIYREGASILPPAEIPDHMKGHNNPNDLILNYFTFKFTDK